MFKIKDGRLYPNLKPMGLSFNLPEGFWIVTYADSDSPNYIVFRTADEAATVSVSLGFREFDDTAEELLDTMDGCPAENLDGPYPIDVNGIKGHYLFVANDNAQYVVLLDVGAYNFKCREAIVDPSGEHIIDRIEFVVSVKSEEGAKAMADAHAAASREDVMEFLHSFEVK
ncbi:MAG: hypothetical protein LIO60_08680 [Oscillospiraceae bacterium]|nr:hypothetical protein [Oscillospiraceae bacterium]